VVYVARVVRAGIAEPTELAALTVPAGNYVITAKLVASRGSSEGPLAGTVVLSTGDRAYLEHFNRSRNMVDDVHGWPVVLHDVATFGWRTRISLVGANQSPGRGWQADGVILTALKVGAINPPFSLLGTLEPEMDASNLVSSMSRDQWETARPLSSATDDPCREVKAELASIQVQLRHANEALEELTEQHRALQAKLDGGDQPPD
jgi:hypothetical protein